MARLVGDFELTRWDRREPEFGGLREYDDGGDEPITVMELTPETRDAGWATTRGLWLEAAPHPNVLDALEPSGDAVLLRYAALQWGPRLNATSSDILPAWAVQVVDALLTVFADVPSELAGWLANPVCKLDVGGQLRLAFLSVDSLDYARSRFIAPEAMQTWPALDARALVFLAGMLLRAVWTAAPDGSNLPIAAIAVRAANPDPAKRYPSLEALADALLLVRCDFTSIRHGDALLAWTEAEAGAGLLALGHHERALARFKRGLELDTECGLAIVGFNRAAELCGRDDLHIDERNPYRIRAWKEVEPIGRRLEAARAFRPALEEYLTVMRASAPGDALDRALARCHLALGESDHAVYFARRALELDPNQPETSAILIEALLARAENADALERADALVAARREDARAHYLRAKCLLALRRLVEARAAFELALRLQPTMVDAMVLRREVDRLRSGIRAVVGPTEVSHAIGSGHLEPIRAMVIEGRRADALAALAKAERERDPAAQLMRGDLLLAEDRAGEALDVYLRASQLGADTRSAAVVGTGLALLALGRAEEALEMFEHVPESLDALEGRARALEALGRGEEAEAARKRHVEAAAARSDLRLQVK